jgi:hypothetical protein
VRSNDWKIEALKRFPEIPKDETAKWDNPWTCWHFLFSLFEDEYRKPRNEDLIKRIYEFSEWCINYGETVNRDMSGAVITGFYEDMPTIPAAMEDMPRWFSLEEIQGSHAIFKYMIGEEGYNKILEIYKKWKDEGRAIKEYDGGPLPK